MNTRQLNLRFLFSHDIKPLLLLVTSVAGLSVGIALSYCNPYLFSGIDKAELLSSPSLLNLLIVNLIPICLLYILLSLSLYLLCYPMVFLWGMISGCFEISLLYLFGDCAWLIRFFLLFSHYITSSLWWLLLFRNAKRFRAHLLKDTCFSVFLILFVTVFDVYVIAPFLSDVFSTI